MSEKVEIITPTDTEGGMNEKLDSVEKLVPLTPSALQHFDEKKQQQILAVSEQIDVRQLEKVMAYGQSPLIRSFEAAGRILHEDQGTSADQKVIKEVIELAKQANGSYDDFNLAIKEPSFLQKALMKIFTSIKDKQENEVSVKAVTSYKLLEQLSSSCDKWIDMLQDAFEKIHLSALDDKANCEELEQYIVAGRIAQERINAEVEAAKSDYELTGLVADKERYEELKDGADTFALQLLNLEKSRAAFAISIGQLYLTERTNRNMQMAVRTQRANSMALTGQQLRNAVLEAKNRIVLEGQKSISGLNSELMKKISQNAVLTAEESEQVLLSGVYSVEAALEAAKTVVEGCNAIENARTQRNASMSQELDRLKSLLGEIEPFVTRLQETTTKDPSVSTSKTATGSTGGIKF